MLAFFYVTAALVVLCAVASTPWLEGIEAIVLRTDLTLRKEILWESERATDAEVHAMEMKLNRENGTNDRPSATTSYRSGVRA